jgi:hypothetical protein
MRPRLRLFTGDDEVSTLPNPAVSVRLGEIVYALSDAVQSNRSWVNDFENDEIQIPADLYDVLSSYMHLRPGA